MTNKFIPYLYELRHRLIRLITFFFVIFIVLFPFRAPVYEWMSRPMSLYLHKGHMIATAVMSSFWVPIKAIGFVAFFIGLPFFIWEFWSFVQPALYRHEKKAVFPMVCMAYILFLLGMIFCYFVVFPFAFRFSASSAPANVLLMTDIDCYWQFVLSSFLSFGVCFELPVLMFIGYSVGWFSYDKYREYRRYAVVLSFVVAAVFSPPDVLSQCLLALPLCVLYELGIFFVKVDSFMSAS